MIIIIGMEALKEGGPATVSFIIEMTSRSQYIDIRCDGHISGRVIRCLLAILNGYSEEELQRYPQIAQLIKLLQSTFQAVPLYYHGASNKGHFEVIIAPNASNYKYPKEHYHPL